MLVADLFPHRLLALTFATTFRLAWALALNLLTTRKAVIAVCSSAFVLLDLLTPAFLSLFGRLLSLSSLALADLA